MYLKEGVNPIAPAASDGGVSVYQVLDRDDRASGAWALPPVALVVDVALARMLELPSQADHAERGTISRPRTCCR